MTFAIPRHDRYTILENAETVNKALRCEIPTAFGRYVSAVYALGSGSDYAEGPGLSDKHVSAADRLVSSPKK